MDRQVASEMTLTEGEGFTIGVLLAGVGPRPIGAMGVLVAGVDSGPRPVGSDSLCADMGVTRDGMSLLPAQEELLFVIFVIDN